MSKQDDSVPPAPGGEPPGRNRDGDWRPIPDSVLAIFAGILVLALVLGYLLLNKMADISRQEDCMLGHRTNCAANE